LIVLFFRGIIDSLASVAPRCTQLSIRRIAHSIGTAALLAVVICAGPSVFASGESPPKRILILYSFYNGEGVFGGFDPALRSALRTRYPGRVEFHNQYLDLGRFPDARHQEMLAESLRLQYSQTELDLIIPVSLPAVNFLLHYGDQVFPGIPVVFSFLAERWIKPLHLGPQPDGTARNITGLAGNYASMSSPNTLDLALQLQPDTRRVVVIVGSYDYEKMWLKQWQADLAGYAERLDVTYLTDLPMAEVQKQVAVLPPHTIILYPFFARDSEGRFFLPEEALDMIRARANAPVYGMFPLYLDHEVVGCRCVDLSKDGEEVAILAARVLAGEKAGAIPVVIKDTSRNVVDWRELKRWGISESRVPPGTEVLFRQRTLWQEYGLYLVGGVVLLVLETGLLAAIVIQLRRRRRAERDRRREKIFSDALIESLPGIFYLFDDQGALLRWNRNTETFSGHNSREMRDLRLGACAAPADRAMVEGFFQEVISQGVAQMEPGLVNDRNESIPHYFTGTRVELEGRRFVLALGVDISELRKAERALAASELKFRTIFEGSAAGMSLASTTGVMLEANSAMCRFLGYSGPSCRALPSRQWPILRIGKPVRRGCSRCSPVRSTASASKSVIATRMARCDGVT